MERPEFMSSRVVKIKSVDTNAKLGMNLDNEIFKIISKRCEGSPHAGMALQKVMESLLFHGVQCSKHLFKDEEYAKKAVRETVEEAIKKIFV